MFRSLFILLQIMFPRFNWLIEPTFGHRQLTCQILGYFFREYAHKIALSSNFFSA